MVSEIWRYYLEGAAEFRLVVKLVALVSRGHEFESLYGT